MNILHIAYLEKFIPSFIELMRKEFSDIEQYFYTYGDFNKYPYENGDDSYHSYEKNNKFFSILSRYPPLIKKMYQADKIILHGLFDIKLVIILCINPWLLKKCYWVIWGGDLYCHQDNVMPRSLYKSICEVFRRFAIKRLGYLVTYIPGDIDRVRSWYGAKGVYCKCIMYISNTFDAVPISNDSKNKEISIQIGNSADSVNNHIDVFELIKYQGERSIKIYVPLSYGNKDYANKIISLGNDMFGDKFIPIVDFMSIEKYIQYMTNIDIAIFNHTRQQGMGNLISFLGLGKTVYIRDSTSQWDLMNELNILVKSIDDYDGSTLSIEQSVHNIKKVKDIFSCENLCQQWRSILK